MLVHEKDLDTPEKYWYKMGQGTGWATVVEVQVAAMMYNIGINVYLQHSIQVNQNLLECQNNVSCTLQTYTNNAQTSEDSTVSLLLSRGHFQVLMKKKSKAMNTSCLVQNSILPGVQENEICSRSNKRLSTLSSIRNEVPSKLQKKNQ
jgi:hypothetical protein